MRPDLFEQCPVCSPILGNAALTLVPLVEDPLTGDILEGWLLGRDNDRYPILGGVAILVPDPGAYVASRPSQWELSEIVSPDLRQWVQEQSLRPSQDRYDSPRVIDEYLWTHYGGPPEPPAPPLPDSWTAFYQPVAQALGNLPPEYRTVYAVDAGCNVGRLAYAAAEVYRFVLGFDYSWGSIRAARELLRRGTWRHRRRVEGTLTEPVTYTAPPARNLEFIVADVQHPPLPRHRAAAVAGMHLLDRVPDPFAALDALDNLLMPSGRLVLTASFSWDAAYAATERWLGGTPEAGESLPNLIRLLEAKGYSGLSTQEVCLVIRETRRFYQVSCGALVTGRKR